MSSATADLVYINLQPQYELPSLTHFRQFCIGSEVITFGYSHLMLSFFVSAVVVPVSILTSMLYANLLARTISQINKEY